MAKDKPGKQSELTICDLYPQLDEDQLKEAEQNLARYLEFVLRIYDRIRSDPETYSQFQALTASGREARIKTERPSPP